MNDKTLELLTLRGKGTSLRPAAEAGRGNRVNAYFTKAKSGVSMAFRPASAQQLVGKQLAFIPQLSVIHDP